MVYIICQIRTQLRVLKNWYGCSVAEQVTHIDLYNQYASWQLDNSEAIPTEFATSRVSCSLGQNKREMVMVSPDVAVGEGVSTLGRFVGFGVEEQEYAAWVRHSVIQSSTNFLYLNVSLESRSSPMYMYTTCMATDQTVNYKQPPTPGT